MSVTTSRPINLGQLAEEIGTRELTMQETSDGRERTVASNERTDAQLRAAVDGHTADPYFGRPEDSQIVALRAKAQAVFAGSDTFTPAQVQKILAGLVLRATR